MLAFWTFRGQWLLSGMVLKSLNFLNLRFLWFIRCFAYKMAWLSPARDLDTAQSEIVKTLTESFIYWITDCILTVSCWIFPDFTRGIQRGRGSVCTSFRCCFPNRQQRKCAKDQLVKGRVGKGEIVLRHHVECSDCVFVNGLFKTIHICVILGDGKPLTFTFPAIVGGFGGRWASEVIPKPSFCSLGQSHAAGQLSFYFQLTIFTHGFQALQAKESPH